MTLKIEDIFKPASGEEVQQRRIKRKKEVNAFADKLAMWIELKSDYNATKIDDDPTAEFVWIKMTTDKAIIAYIGVLYSTESDVWEVWMEHPKHRDIELFGKRFPGQNPPRVDDVVGEIVSYRPDEKYTVPLSEDIFKPAKEKEVTSRKRKFNSEKRKALAATLSVIRDFTDMYYEFTRDDEDPPEYLTSLNDEMRMLRKEVIPEDPDSIIDIYNRAKELFRQLRIYVTGEDVNEDIFKPASKKDIQKREEEHNEKIGWNSFRRIVDKLKTMYENNDFTIDDSSSFINIIDKSDNWTVISLTYIEDSNDELAAVISFENHWVTGVDENFDVYPKVNEKAVVSYVIKNINEYLEDKNAATNPSRDMQDR